ncbi:diacylglycerol kinase [Stutzerimonas stutzeri]|uniref:diacylglycerol kinase n=1 Tax=Stutzerimonas sp. S1 TaxID=3030652 RepID=UPI002223FF6C|nr:diacylglycerol kinase [Stutzerimonas sp. S1]MCW3149275.1 diacylglycerol kinase [Stutzerimonas sp. S1]
MKGQPFHRRMAFALSGLRQAWRRERSLRTHLVVVALLLLVLLLTRPAAVWWAILTLTAGLVLVAELLNSALETLLDHLHPQHHREIGAAKDIAAAAVLVASLVALGVAVAFFFSLLSD